MGQQLPPPSPSPQQLLQLLLRPQKGLLQLQQLQLRPQKVAKQGLLAYSRATLIPRTSAPCQGRSYSRMVKAVDLAAM